MDALWNVACPRKNPHLEATIVAIRELDLEVHD